MEDIPKRINCNDAEFEINYVQQQKNGAVNFSLLTQLMFIYRYQTLFSWPGI